MSSRRYETLVSSQIRASGPDDFSTFLIRLAGTDRMPAYRSKDKSCRTEEHYHLGCFGVFFLRLGQAHCKAGAAVAVFSGEHPPVRFNDGPGNR